MIGFFTILLVSGLLAKLLDAWLRKSDKDKLTEKLTEIWLKIDDSSLTSVSQAPMRIFSALLDALLGNQVFTGKAIWRTAVLSTCLMVISLSVGGIIVKTPFAFETPPWTSFDNQFKFFATYPDVYNKTIQKQKALNPQMLDAAVKQKNFVLALSKYNTTTYKIIYSISTTILSLLVSILIYIISFAFSRMMVREAMEANTYLLMFSIMFLNLCIGIVLAFIAVLLLWISAYPLMVLCFRYFLIPLLSIPILNIISLLGFTTAIWFLGSLWIKIAATVAILPMICLILVLFISWLLYPFRKQIKELLSQGLLRALEHEKGIFVFISITFSCIGGIAVAIAKLF
jgi:hypothetical protein